MVVLLQLQGCLERFRDVKSMFCGIVCRMWVVSKNLSTSCVAVKHYGPSWDLRDEDVYLHETTDARKFSACVSMRASKSVKL